MGGDDGDKPRRSFSRSQIEKLHNAFHVFLTRHHFSTYSVVFVLGFVCSLLYGWLRVETLPEPVTAAGAAVSKAYDDVLSSEALEKLLNSTKGLKNKLDSQAAAVTGRVKNASAGVTEYFSTLKPRIGQDEVRIGQRMFQEGTRVLHPVVMIPGIITTGLEVWDGEACIKSYFRQRIWGSTTMLQSILSDPDCWVRHLALNSTTGLDPLQRPDYNRSIRVRASQGFESADFFVAGYWIWGVLIEALADIGYDINTMYMASYDWRLSFADLEIRDRYFSRLRYHIETLVSMSGVKVVVLSHSMGSNVWHYFLQWVTHRWHSNWVHDHISSEIHISAPMLGLPKAYYSMLTGDNRDFASMGTGFSAIMNHLFGPSTRRKLWRSCSSLAMIMPIGGEAVWGERFLGRPLLYLGDRPLNVSETQDLLATEGAVPEDLKRMSDWLLDGMRRAAPLQPPKAHEPVPEHVWGNALASPLPFAPKMKKYVFYGVGVKTDVSAVVRDVGDDVQQPRYAIDVKATKDFGFHFGDGDYSVPLVSLGLMCLRGWKDDRRNPARIPCVVKEYVDNPTKKAPASTAGAAANSAQQTMAALLSGGYTRGGQPSGDHIDILGNDELLRDVLTVVSGGEVRERVTSQVKALAERWIDE